MEASCRYATNLLSLTCRIRASHFKPVPTRQNLLWPILLLPRLLHAIAAGAAEVTWTGSVDSSPCAGNGRRRPGRTTSPSRPASPPTAGIGATNTADIYTAIWRRIQPNASVKVLNSGDPAYPNALYIITGGFTMTVFRTSQSAMRASWWVITTWMAAFPTSPMRIHDDEIPDAASFITGRDERSPPLV